MFVEAVTGAVVDKIWDERKLIGSFVRDFYELLTKGGLKVFVFGCAGTGKSTFGRIVSDHEHMAKLSGQYSLSADTEVYGVEGKHFVQVAVPPGQEAFRQRHWGQLFNALQQSRRAVIVNIGCWGYHSVEHEELKRIPAFGSGITKATKAVFLNENREKEIAAIEQITSPISHFQNPLHMITLVTKQDLWWKERKLVEAHYKTEPRYVRAIQAIADAKGQANFTHHFKSVSFGQINFKTADSKVIQETASGYDNGLLNANFEDFLALLRQIAK